MIYAWLTRNLKLFFFFFQMAIEWPGKELSHIFPRLENEQFYDQGDEQIDDQQGFRHEGVMLWFWDIASTCLVFQRLRMHQ